MARAMMTEIQRPEPELTVRDVQSSHGSYSAVETRSWKPRVTMTEYKLHVGQDGKRNEDVIDVLRNQSEVEG